MNNLMNSRIKLFRAETNSDGKGGFAITETFIDTFFCQILSINDKRLVLALRFHPEIKKDMTLIFEEKKYKFIRLNDLRNGFLKLWFESNGENEENL